MFCDYHLTKNNKIAKNSATTEKKSAHILNPGENIDV
jgi:hypothetical protein